MRSDAKRPTVGSNRRRATALGRLAVLALAAAALAAAFVPAPAIASKEVVGFLGEASSDEDAGGQFSVPWDVAVNDTGAGPAEQGDIYVVDTSGHRIQRFDSEGEWISAWGADVVKPGGTGDVSTGTSPFEICVVAAECKLGAATGGNGTASGNGSLSIPRAVAVDGDTGDVYVADRNNRRVNVYDGAGAFIVSFGFDVQEGGVTTYEICGDEPGDICKAGVAGAGIGQVGGLSASGPGIAVSPPDGVAGTGTVYLADNGNRRVNTYELDGTSPSSFGSSANFASGSPTVIAVDSRGIVYANGGISVSRVERYDSEDANGGGIGFLSPIHAENATPTPGPLLTGSTPGLAVDPDSDGGGPDTDLLYVLSDPSAGGAPTVAQQFGPANAPGLTAPPVAVDDTHGSLADLRGVQGMGFDGVGDRLFLVPSIEAGFSRRVLVLKDVATLGSLSPAVDEVTVKTDTTATFSGTVDPSGGVVECDFEYSTDQTDWSTLVVSGCDSLALDGGSQAISAQVAGLVPNTRYFVRLRASRLLMPESSVTTGIRAFDTVAPPPVVTDIGAVQVQNTSARLVGTVDPRNNLAGYFFEYGLTPALGSSTAPLAIGGGTTPVTVSQVIGGLKPDTPYYFRVVATNLVGTTESPSHTFRTRTAPSPSPGGRGLEMVTPPDKNYTDANNVAVDTDNIATFSPDGNSVAFCTTALFGEPPSRMTNLCAPYMGRRGAGGWQTSHPFPPTCHVDFGTGAITGFQNIAVSPDFTRFVVQQPESPDCPGGLLDPAAPLIDEPQEFGSNLYYENPDADPFTFHLLNPATRASVADMQQLWLGGSSDFSRVVYVSSVNQTDEPDSPPPSNEQKLYLWRIQGEEGCAQPGGCLSLLSKDTGGDPFATASMLPGTMSEGGPSFIEDTAVSADGGRVFFHNPVSHKGAVFFGLGQTCDDPGCGIYVREGNHTTIKVSESECTLGAACGDPDLPANFLRATPSGEKAFFFTSSKLTDSPGPTGGRKLYRWDATAPGGARLIELSTDREPSDGETPGISSKLRPAVLIGSSEDGDTVFFVASGQLVPGADTAPEEKLYRWRWNGGDPGLDYLGPYGGALAVDTDQNTHGLRRLVTPDGKYLMLYSELRLDPAADSDSDIDVYRWDEEGGWRCASCQLPGAPSAGNVSLENPRLKHYETAFPTISDLQSDTAMSEDGQRIFFGTPDALVSADTNGEVGCPIDNNSVKADSRFIYTCTDVYEWHDGTISLLSGGTGSGPARLIGATASGRDVFFYTGERLVGWDVDLNVDIYDARLGGGFPEPPAQPPECEGEACRGGGTDAPEVAGAGSAVFQGAGNPSGERAGNRRCPGNRLRRGKRCLTVVALARKRCRRLSGVAKRRCIRRQSRRLRRAQRRRAQHRQQRASARRANFDRRAVR